MITTAFFGSSEYSVRILQKLLGFPDFKVNQVITKEDKPVGRTQTITPNPVARFARDNNLHLLQVSEFTPEVKLDIRNLSLDIALCVAFGPPFFDQEMIDLFKYKIVNIHPSPLPKYRGATPGPWQIINGENKSAVSFFQIDEKPDHGPIIAQLPFTIDPGETSTSFYDKAFDIASDNLEQVLINYANNPRIITEQDHASRTYFPKFDKETARIDWSWEPGKIYRFINALLPWPVAWTFVEDQKGNRLKMKVFSSTLNFKLSTLNLQEVQLEGKTRTNWSEIEKYYRIIK